MEVIKETPDRRNYERSWGVVTDLLLASDPGTFDFCLLHISPGESIPPHTHDLATEYEAPISGDGWILMANGERLRIEDGKILGEEDSGSLWEPGCVHGYEADPTGDGLVIFNVSSPRWTEDIVVS